jgi:hypothetical protein
MLFAALPGAYLPLTGHTSAVAALQIDGEAALVAVDGVTLLFVTHDTGGQNGPWCGLRTGAGGFTLGGRDSSRLPPV